MDSTALSRSDSIVLIPTYNEKENIAAIIHAVFELPVSSIYSSSTTTPPTEQEQLSKIYKNNFRALSTSWNEPGNKG